MNNFTSAEQAVQHFAAEPIAEGYQFQALHAYTDLKNNILYWRIRLKNQSCQKWIRPMYKDTNNQYYLAEPPTLNPRAKVSAPQTPLLRHN